MYTYIYHSSVSVKIFILNLELSGLQCLSKVTHGLTLC